MKINKLIKLIISIILCQLAGLIGSFFTTPAIPSWYQKLVKPFLLPPIGSLLRCGSAFIF